jgi:hypothetical protein
VTGPATIVEGKLVAHAAGAIWLKAEQAGNDTYGQASASAVYNVRQAAVSLAGQYSDTSEFHDIEVNGRVLYAACGQQGFRIFDITDPARPALISQYPAPTALSKINALKIAVADNMAYVLAEQVTDAESGNILTGRSFDIFDVTDPARPALLGSMPKDDPDIFLSSGEPQSIQVVGEFAYIVMGGWLWIVDVSNPAAPALIYRFDEMGVYISQVAGSLLYVAAEAGLRIFDVSAPRQPRQVGGSDPLWPQDAWHAPVDMRVTGQTLYLLTPDALLTLQGDPTNLALVGSSPIDSWATALDVSGSYIFCYRKKLSERSGGSTSSGRCRTVRRDKPDPYYSGRRFPKFR